MGGHKTGHKYPLKPGEVAILHLIGQHPGLTAAEFAALLWPHLKKGQPARLLDKLRHKGILGRRIEPADYYKGGPVPPKVRHYFTSFGYAAYEYWQRQGQS